MDFIRQTIFKNKAFSVLVGVVLLCLLAFVSWSARATVMETNVVSDDGFVTIPGGTYTVGCDENGDGCRETTVREFRIRNHQTTIGEWSECVRDGLCAVPKQPFDSAGSQVAISGLSMDQVTRYFQWKQKQTSLLNEVQWEVILTLLNHKRPSGLSLDGTIDRDLRPVNVKRQNNFGLSGFTENKPFLLSLEGECMIGFHYGAKKMDCTMITTNAVIWEVFSGFND